MKMMQEINELRLDCTLKQKRGLHIILALIIIWLVILIIQFYIILTNKLSFKADFSVDVRIIRAGKLSQLKSNIENILTG